MSNSYLNKRAIYEDTMVDVPSAKRNRSLQMGKPARWSHIKVNSVVNILAAV